MTALLVLGGLAAAIDRALMNRLVVQNDSSSEARGLRIVVFAIRDHSVIAGVSVDKLPPGASVTLRHRCNDVCVELSATLDNASVQHRDEYVDYWTGQAWVVRVEDGGVVDSGYEGVSDSK